jgi:hypothetical protein
MGALQVEIKCILTGSVQVSLKVKVVRMRKPIKAMDREGNFSLMGHLCHVSEVRELEAYTKELEQRIEEQTEIIDDLKKGEVDFYNTENIEIKDKLKVAREALEEIRVMAHCTEKVSGFTNLSCAVRSISDKALEALGEME